MVRTGSSKQRPSGTVYVLLRDAPIRTNRFEIRGKICGPVGRYVYILRRDAPIRTNRFADLCEFGDLRESARGSGNSAGHQRVLKSYLDQSFPGVKKGGKRGEVRGKRGKRTGPEGKEGG